MRKKHIAIQLPSDIDADVDRHAKRYIIGTSPNATSQVGSLVFDNSIGNMGRITSARSDIVYAPLTRPTDRIHVSRNDAYLPTEKMLPKSVALAEAAKLAAEAALHRQKSMQPA